MIRRTQSARSTDSLPNCYPHRGFSLVEVMMSIVLLVTGAVLAIPSYQGMVDKRQVPNVTEQVASEQRSPSKDFRLNLVVDNAGRAVLCSDHRLHNVPGYQTCPTQEGPES